MKENNGHFHAARVNRSQNKQAQSIEITFSRPKPGYPASYNQHHSTFLGQPQYRCCKGDFFKVSFE